MLFVWKTKQNKKQNKTKTKNKQTNKQKTKNKQTKQSKKKQNKQTKKKTSNIFWQNEHIMCAGVEEKDSKQVPQEYSNCHWNYPIISHDQIMNEWLIIGEKNSSEDGMNMTLDSKLMTLIGSCRSLCYLYDRITCTG